MPHSRRTSQKSTRFLFVLIIASALLLSSIVPFTRAGKPLQDRTPRSDGARPQPGRPEGTFPNLDEVRRRRQVPPSAAPAIPSSIRSRRKPLVPRNGRRVGDEAEVVAPQESLVGSARQSSKTSRSVIKKARSHHPRISSPPLADDQYMQNFFYWALTHAPNAAEATYWMDMQRSAYANGQGSLVLAIREMGKTLFESAEYARRDNGHRLDMDYAHRHAYVRDLYLAYLMREPDPGGWSFWEGLVQTLGHEAVRRAFDESTEFINLVNTISLSGSPSSAVSSLVTARTDPFNQPGSGLMSREANWSVSLLSLPGRAGLDLGLGLSYSSMVWTLSGPATSPYLYFDEDNGSPSPGFRLGFPTIQERFFNAKVGDNVYLFITSGGRRVELRQVGASNIYEAADSSYLQLTDNGASLLVRSTDGTRMTYSKFQEEWRCQEIKDRNGNFLSVNYNTIGDLTTVTDTLGRVITFNYDGNANLTSITQPWSTGSHPWATFGWGTKTQDTFVGNSVVGAPSGTSVPVLTQVSLHDGSRYDFQYTNALQVFMIRRYNSVNVERAYTIFDYDTAIDCPRLTTVRVQADNWTDVNDLPPEVVTQYSGTGDSWRQLTAPDGTVYKEFYGSGWQRGLVTTSEVWSGGVRQKWTEMAWTQDNTNLSYQLNPRVTETNVYDAAGNRKRTGIEYHTTFGLPLCITEYAADGASVLRFTVHHYNFDAQYLDRRIIGLPASEWVFSSSWQVLSKTSYGYDWGSHLEGLPGGAAAVQHDANYGTNFVGGRGNLSVVTRWDAIDDNNYSKAVEQKYGHNITGSVTFTRDPLWHQKSISYTDSFADSVNRNSFAYPTTLTEGGNNFLLQYSFELGAKTRAQGPPPAQQTQGRITTFTYDAAARIDRVTTTNNGAYTKFIYGPDDVETVSTVNTLTDEASSLQVFNGAGGVFKTVRKHPGSSGGLSTQVTYYDVMGRMAKQSNPTETNASFDAWGDDVAGWLYTTQTYDWQGRPVRTTHPDLTHKDASYGGCGCAGGQVVTLTDEGTIDAGTPKRRQQKIYADVLGRTVKSETLTWENGSVYSATVNTYNALDQVTKVRQWSGAEGTGTYQDTEMTYDGHGRLKTRHVPEQNAGTATTWDYKADDTVEKITDARGASQTFSYNSRHLVTGITYAVPGGSGITVPAAVSFEYDAAGNRTSMSDGSGSTSYHFDQLSRMDWEERTFTGLTGSTYRLSYAYNLAGALTSLTEPSQFGSSVSYGYDQAGRLSSVSGSGFAGGVSQFASGINYRAWNSVKEMSYGNGLRLNNGFNSSLQLTSYQVKVPNTPVGQGERARTDYEYNADGEIKIAYDRTDEGFNRYYTYDHASRLIGASAGNGAYVLGLDYDTFGNLTQRETLSWRAYHTLTSQYQDNRNTQTTTWSPPNAPVLTNLTHDSDGRIKNDHNKEYTVDAGGHLRRTFETTIIDATLTKRLWIYQDYDGNGVRAKRVEQQQYNQGAYAFVTSYYLRSSVLNGKVVTELNELGLKRETTVYANGMALIKQKDNLVRWIHTDPVTNSIRETMSNSVGVNRVEFDPLGNDAPLQDPLPPELTPDYEYLGNYGSSGNPYDGASGCMLDGQPIPCGLMWRLAGSGKRMAGSYLSLGDSTASAVWVDEWEDVATAPGTASISGGTTVNGNVTTAIRNVGRFIFTNSSKPNKGVQQNTYDPRADFRDYAKQLSHNRGMRDCMKLALMIYKAGQVWGGGGADSIVGGLLRGLTEFSAIGHDGGSPSDPNFRVGVMRSDPQGNYAASFGQQGFNGRYGGGGFINPFPDNQVRHFVGWFGAGYSVNSAYAEAALFGQEGTLRNRDPDVALGRAGIALGGSFRGDFKKLAQDVWTQICGEKGALNLP